MTTESIVKCAWAEYVGLFVYHQDPDSGKITKRFGKIKLEIINSVHHLLENLHDYIYIYIYVCVCVCACVCIYIYIYIYYNRIHGLYL